MRHEVTSNDGTKVGYFIEGEGAPIVIVHGGSQRASDWTRVASTLKDRFTVARIDRSLYAKTRPVARHSMQREVDDLGAVLAEMETPTVLVGHSSGGVVALEFALRHQSTLAGLLLYEPPVADDVPVGGEPLIRAEAAIARGDHSAALEIFLKGMVQFSPWFVWLVRHIPFAWRHWCGLAPQQIADVRAIESLGIGLKRFRSLDVPTLLLGGASSPAHLRRRLHSLIGVLPRSRTTIVPGWGHVANLRSHEKLANIVAEFATRCNEHHGSSVV
jgi:pimeloyl-ACP methyl ester carboxylesterase